MTTKLQLLIAERGDTYKSLADQLGISPHHIARIAQGKRYPSIPVAVRLQEIFGERKLRLKDFILAVDES